jgi:hypothetical protein
VLAEQLAPQPGERDLADRGRSLGIGERTAPALGEPELRGAERDRARTDHDHLLTARAGLGDLAGEPGEPLAVRLAAVAHQQGRADLEHEARAGGGIGQVGEAFDRHCGALAESGEAGKASTFAIPCSSL